MLPEVAADVLREGAAPGVRVLASHGGGAGGGRGRGPQRGRSLVVVEGRRLGVVDHPHGAVVDGPGAEVVLADSEAGETHLEKAASQMMGFSFPSFLKHRGVSKNECSDQRSGDF